MAVLINLMGSRRLRGSFFVIRMLLVGPRQVALDANILGLHEINGAADIGFLVLGKLFLAEGLGNLGVLAPRPVTRFTRGANQTGGLRLAQEPGGFAVPSRMAFQAVVVFVVFGRKNVKTFGMFGFAPGEELVKVARGAFLGSHVGLPRGRLVQRLRCLSQYGRCAGPDELVVD